MPLDDILLVLLAVLIGGNLQRVSGMGMGLVLAPVLSIILGPAAGVTVTNTTTVMSAALIGWVLRANIDWPRFATIAVAAVFGSIPGALLVKNLDGAWLSVVVGGVILLALLVTVGTSRLRGLPEIHSLAWLLPFGAVGAFLNTTAGVAAPAFVIYSLMARWRQESFQATMQPTFGLVGLISIVTKVGFGATPLSVLPPLWMFGLILVTILVAILTGNRIAKRVSPGQARNVAVVVAGLGAVSALVRGLAKVMG